MVEPASLLRQAEEKELLADRFEGYMKSLENLLDRAKTDSADDGPVWTGAAAQRFEQDAMRRRSDVIRLAEQCQAAARSLRKSALQLRERARLLRVPL